MLSLFFIAAAFCIGALVGIIAGRRMHARYVYRLAGKQIKEAIQKDANRRKEELEALRRAGGAND